MAARQLLLLLPWGGYGQGNLICFEVAAEEEHQEEGEREREKRAPLHARLSYQLRKSAAQVLHLHAAALTCDFLPLSTCRHVVRRYSVRILLRPGGFSRACHSEFHN